MPLPMPKKISKNWHWMNRLPTHIRNCPAYTSHVLHLATTHKNDKARCSVLIQRNKGIIKNQQRCKVLPVLMSSRHI